MAHPVGPDVPGWAVDALGRVSTATLTTQLFARGLRNAYLAGLRPLSPGHARMVGEAFTLRYIPAREDLDVLGVFSDPAHPQRHSVELVGPGQVLVMDCRGQGRAASLGAILATRLLRRGAAGIVTDGSVRDSGEIAGLPLPTFTAGVAATTNLAQHHAVDFQVPIGCAEVPIYPGDYLVGDVEGVVCLPRHLVTEVARAALLQEHREKFLTAQVDAGAPLPGTYPPNEQTLARYDAWAREHPLPVALPDPD